MRHVSTLARHATIAEKFAYQRKCEIRYLWEMSTNPYSVQMDESMGETVARFTPKNLKDPAKALAIGWWSWILSLNKPPRFGWGNHEAMETIHGELGREAGFYVFDLQDYYYATQPNPTTDS